MSTVTSSDGTVIDYESHGSGPAVVHIGGASQYRAIDPGSTEVMRSLGEAGHTGVSYDRRGRGTSGDTAPWALEREVEDLAAVIDAVGGPAVLYTSSSGATIGLAAAANGVDVRALALFEPPFFAGRDMTGQLAQLRSLAAAGQLDAAMRYNLTAVIGIPQSVVDGMAASPSWAGMVAVAATLPYDIGACQEINVDPDWATRWAKVTVPAIVCSGDRTFPGMPEAADAVAAALADSNREILPGQSHGPQPDAIVPVLLTFLRDL